MSKKKKMNNQSILTVFLLYKKNLSLFYCVICNENTKIILY